MSGSPLAVDAALHRMVRYQAREEILKSVGDVSDMRLFGNQVLLAPYVHSGILWSDRLGFPLDEVLSLEALYELYDSGKGMIVPGHSVESIYQGKLLLVLKLGDEANKYGLKEGDWVWALQEVTRQLSLSRRNSTESRVLKAINVNYGPGWPCKIAYETDLGGQEIDPFRMV